MGGYDTFCAICGARASKPYWSEPEEYDNSVMETHDSSWMEDVRIICENPEVPFMDKYVFECFLNITAL